MKNMRNCPFCGQEKIEYLFDNHDRIYDNEEAFHICRCSACKLIFVNPQPSPEELERYYPKKEYCSFRAQENFFNRLGRFFNLMHYKCQDKWYGFLFLPLAPFLSYTEITRGGKVLDVGCGEGEFLARMKILGMDVYGVEPNLDPAEVISPRAISLNIKKCFLEQAKFNDNFFDVIRLSHVFEHLPDPFSTLIEARRILKPGGILIISLPTTDSALFKLFKKYWMPLDTPRHLFLFSSSLFYKIADKYDFKLKRIRFYLPPALISSSIYFLIEKKIFKKNPIKDYGFFSYFFAIILLPIAYLFNFFKIGDCMEVFLQKRD